MARLYKELKHFIAQIRAGYPRQADEEGYYRIVRPLLSLELGPYTYIECITAAYTSGIPRDYISRVGYMLFARSNRGKATMKQVRKLLGHWPKRFPHE